MEPQESLEEIIKRNGIWSCDPSTILPWTEEQKAALTKALSKAFGWEENDQQQK